LRRLIGRGAIVRMNGQNEGFSARGFWRILRILWAALIVSQSLFLLVLWVVRWGPNGQALPLPPDPVLFTVLSGVAGGAALMSWVLPLLLFQRRAGGTPAPQPGESLPPPVMKRLLPAVQPAFMLAWSLSEAVSLSGFVLGFLGFPAEKFAPFFVVGIGMTVLRFPTERWLHLALGSPRAL
jgi:hypothetical protein